MARTYVVFGDIEGKLDVLRVECRRCQRKGRYSVRKLIEKYGRRGHMMKWREQLSSDDRPNNLCGLLDRIQRLRSLEHLRQIGADQVAAVV
jgi:hypothetical protein